MFRDVEYHLNHKYKYRNLHYSWGICSPTLSQHCDLTFSLQTVQEWELVPVASCL